MRATFLVLLIMLFTAGVKGDEPFGASLSVSGRFAKGYSFRITIAEKGPSLLIVDQPGTPARKELDIPPSKLDELREVLRRERFFELGSTYGDVVPDGSTTTITAHLGGQSKTVTLQYLRPEDPRLPEIRRAVRVSTFLRGLFEHPDAVDTRPYDERVLKVR